MKRILVILVLLFSSSVFGEGIPTSLFGITLKEPVTDYLGSDVNHSPEDDLSHGHDASLIKKLIKNEKFEDYWISDDKNGLVNFITGTQYEFVKNKPEECIKSVLELRNLLSVYYELDINKFVSGHYKYDWLDKDNYNIHIYVYAEQIVSEYNENIDDKKVLTISCTFYQNDKNQMKSGFGISLETLERSTEYYNKINHKFLDSNKFMEELKLLKEDLSGF